MKELEIINPNRTSLQERKEYNQKLNQEFYNSSNKKELLEKSNKKVKYKKIAVYATFITMALAGVTATKVHRDNVEKRIAILSENKTFKSIEIKKGDTIESIAKKLYSELPEDKKVYITLADLKKEIVRMNGLVDPDMIKSGNYLIVPYYLEEVEEVNLSK